MAARSNTREQLDTIYAEMIDKMSALTTSAQWTAMLDNARTFHRYSPNNQLWLAMQGAEGLVASYRTWQKVPAQDGGTCQVAKGEHGLSVLAPMSVINRESDPDTGETTITGRGIRGFRVVKVFHQGQLASPPLLPAQVLPQRLTGDSAHQHIWTAVATMLEDAGYTVNLDTRRADSWNGQTRWDDRTVTVKDDLEPPQRVKTLLHEWAHVSLDHETRQMSRPVKEIEAESVAYLLGATIGLDTTGYTIPYVVDWAGGDVTMIASTAEHVLTSTRTLIERLETELGIDLTPDALAQARTTPAPISGDATIDDPAPAVATNVITMPTAPAALPVELTLPDAGATADFYVPRWVEHHAARLQPEDRNRLYRALNEPGDAASAPTAAVLLAGAGGTARDTFDVLQHYRIPAGEIIAAMTQPVSITELPGDTEPLYTRREVQTIISAASHPSNGHTALQDPTLPLGPPAAPEPSSAPPAPDAAAVMAAIEPHGPGGDIPKPGTAAGILHGWLHPETQPGAGVSVSPALSHQH